jgi:hypothetical protein
VPIHKLPKGRKVKFEMEDVFDDCGDDVTPIVLSLEDSQTAMFLRCFGHQMTVDEQHSFQVDTPEIKEHLYDHAWMDPSFDLWYLTGSSTVFEITLPGAVKFC